MDIEKNLSNALGIDNNRVEEHTEIVPYAIEAELDGFSDQDQDYILARRVLRNLITKGNDAIDQVSEIARQNESARGYEVVATLIKTVADTTKDLYNVQKMKKDLKEPSPESDPRKKVAEGSINVEQAVFVGSTAELLSQLKKSKENESPLQLSEQSELTE